MEPDFRPFPDCESARKWLEENLHKGVELGDSFDQFCSSVKSFTPQVVAERVKHLRLKDMEVVHVRGFDTTLPDTDILNAMAKHFSSCGEILGIRLTARHIPERAAIIDILGEDAKEKAKQLNGSDLGGCKLDVSVACPSMKRNDRPIRGGYVLPESVRRELALKEEANKMKLLSLEKKESEAL